MKKDPKFYDKILKDKTLSSGAFRLWHLFASRTGKNSDCWPGQRSIREDLGLSFDSITRYTKELVTAGYITVERGNRVKSNRYAVLQSCGIGSPIKRYKGAPKTRAELNSGELNKRRQSNSLSLEALEIAKKKFFENNRLTGITTKPIPQ